MQIKKLKSLFSVWPLVLVFSLQLFLICPAQAIFPRSSFPLQFKHLQPLSWLAPYAQGQRQIPATQHRLPASNKTFKHSTQISSSAFSPALCQLAIRRDFSAMTPAHFERLLQLPLEQTPSCGDPSLILRPKAMIRERGIADYAKNFPLLMSELDSMPGKILEVGAGKGQFIQEYAHHRLQLSTTSPIPSEQMIVGIDALPIDDEIEEMKIEETKTELAAQLGRPYLAYYPETSLLKFDHESNRRNFSAIIDYFAAISYSEQVDRELNSMLSLLKVGGKIFIHTPNIHFTMIKLGKKQNTGLYGYLLNIAATAGLEVSTIGTCDYFQDDAKETMSFTIIKKKEGAQVPPLKLISITRDKSIIPLRIYQLDFQNGP